MLHWQLVEAVQATSDGRHTCQMASFPSKAPAWQLQSCRRRSSGYTGRSYPPQGHHIQNSDLKPADVSFWINTKNWTCMWCGCKSFKTNYIIGCFQPANNCWCSFMTKHTYIPNIIESPWAITNSLPYILLNMFLGANLPWTLPGIQHLEQHLKVQHQKCEDWALCPVKYWMTWSSCELWMGNKFHEDTYRKVYRVIMRCLPIEFH